MIRWLAVFLALSANAACVSGFRQGAVVSVAPLEGGSEAERAQFRDTVVRSLAGNIAAEHATELEYTQALAAFERTGPSKARAERVMNLRSSLLSRADYNCNQYLNALGVNRRTYRTGLTVAGTLVGAAGALASPQESAAILSGLAGVLSGVRGNLDEELFASQGLPILINSMDTRRAEMRAAIVSELAPTESSLSPSPENILDRVRVYNEQCSLTRAVSYAIAQTQTAADVAEAAARQQQRTGAGTKP